MLGQLDLGRLRHGVQRHHLGVADPDQQCTAGRPKVGSSRLEQPPHGGPLAERRTFDLLGRRVLGADHDDDVVLGQSQAAAAGLSPGPMGVALPAQERLQLVPSQDAPGVGKPLRLLEVGVGADRGDEVDVAHHPAGDLQRRLTLVGTVDASLGPQRLPGDQAPQPGGVEKRLQRHALVDAPGRTHAGLLQLSVRERLAPGQVGQQGPQVPQRQPGGVTGQGAAGDPVIDDFVPIATGNLPRQLLFAPAETLRDGLNGLVRGRCLTLRRRLCGNVASRRPDFFGFLHGTGGPGHLPWPMAYQGIRERDHHPPPHALREESELCPLQRSRPSSGGDAG